MRCPACSYVGTGNYCQHCGIKLVEDSVQEKHTIVCQGQQKDGSLCGAKLTITNNFCATCGTKVDINKHLINEGENEPVVYINKKVIHEKHVDNAKENKTDVSVRKTGIENDKFTNKLENLKETYNVDNVKETNTLDNERDCVSVDNEKKKENPNNKQETPCNVKGADNKDNDKEADEVGTEKEAKYENNVKDMGNADNFKEKENVETTKQTESMDTGEKKGNVVDEERERKSVENVNGIETIDHNKKRKNIDNEEETQTDTCKKTEISYNASDTEGVTNGSIFLKNEKETEQLDNKKKTEKLDRKKETENVENEERTQIENNLKETEIGDTFKKTEHSDNVCETENLEKIAKPLKNEMGTENEDNDENTECVKYTENVDTVRETDSADSTKEIVSTDVGKKDTNADSLTETENVENSKKTNILETENNINNMDKTIESDYVKNKKGKENMDQTRKEDNEKTKEFVDTVKKDTKKVEHIYSDQKMTSDEDEKFETDDTISTVGNEVIPGAGTRFSATRQELKYDTSARTEIMQDSFSEPSIRKGQCDPDGTEGTDVDLLTKIKGNTNIEVTNTHISDNQNRRGQSGRQTGASTSAAHSSSQASSKHVDPIAFANGQITGTNNVQFHVLISADFKFSPTTDKVEIVFFVDALSDEKWPLEHVRTHSSGEKEFYISLHFKRNFILDKCVSYTYYIKRFTKNSKGIKRKDLWEHYCGRNSRTGKGGCRTLAVHDRFQIADTWHQYDGIVNREMKKRFPAYLFQMASDMIRCNKTHLKHSAKRAMEIFSTHIVNEFKKSKDGDSVLQNVGLVQCLAYCLFRVYVHANNCWTNKENMNNELAGHLILPLFDYVLSLLPKQTDEADRIFSARLLAIVAFLIVLEKLDVFKLLSERQAGLNEICTSLIACPSAKGTSCKEVDFITHHFPESRDTVAKVLVRLVGYIAGQNKNPSWMYLIPLIHFLNGVCEPYESMKFDHSHDNEKPLWWGIRHLNQATIDKFKKKQNIQWETPLGEVIEKLSPCFPLDYLLPRTIMASLNPIEVNDAIQTGLIPFEVCCATIIYLLKTTRPRPHTIHVEQVTFNCMKSLIKGLAKINTQKIDQPSDVLQLQLRMTFDMTKAAIETVRQEPISCSIALFLFAHSRLRQKLHGHGTYQENKNLEECFLGQANFVCVWFENNCCHFLENMDNQLQSWNAVLAPDDIPCDEATITAWNRVLLERLKLHLSEFVKLHKSTFVQYYCKCVEKFKPCLQECMNEIAFQAINHAYVLDITMFSLSERFKFGQLLNEMLKSNRHILLPTEENVGRLSFHPCLSWSPMLQFVKIYFIQTKIRTEQLNIFDEDCNVVLARVITMLENSYDLLIEGNIFIGELKAIRQHENVYADLVQLISSENKKEVATGQILRLIEMRMKESDAFTKHATWMSTLINLCQHKPDVEVSGLENSLRKLEDLNEHVITEFCEPGDAADLDNLECYKPRLTAFGLSEEFIKALPQIHECSDSEIFMKLWIDHCSGNNDGRNLEDVFEKIWIPVKKRWDMVCLNIRKGDIRFCDLEDLMGNIDTDNYKLMTEELKKICLTRHTKEERFNQFEQFRELAKGSSIAKTILKFAETYQLSDSFEEIARIASFDCHSYKMNEIDSTLMIKCDFLKEMTQQRTRCLDIYTECERLVNWLNNAMTGLKELNVFVDLAFMSAGDEPINIARVQCLHSAVTGFAPLIFDLKPTDGYKELIQHCSIVWRELEVNPKLPDQLLDTCRDLEWLNEIKLAHGSVEMTSLCQAGAINDNGIYSVGSAVHRADVVSQQTDLGMPVSLTVAEGKDKENRRKYTCTQLQDLQSRLMLVAGKTEQGNTNVERFTEIYDGVTRLSHAYEQLVRAGCALFINWTSTFFCETTSRVCVIMEFGKKELKGRRTDHKTEKGKENEDLLQCLIPQLANFLERCYEEWLRYIKEKRQDYVHLNYFTIDQLVILQTELVKFNSTDQPSDLIYPLLSVVKKECTKIDLMESMKEAKEDLALFNAKYSSKDTQSEATCLHKVDTDKDLSFVRDLCESGFSETLAWKALSAVGPDDTSKGIIWCIQHQDTECAAEYGSSLGNNDERGYDHTEFKCWSQTSESIQTTISALVDRLSKEESVGVQQFLEQLQQVWSAFLSSLSTDMNDYLNLEHLGKILRFLAQKDISSIARKFPPGLEEGTPNLIICPQGEVLQTTLGVYMCDKDKPLPQSDEVLLCSRDTSKDEVDIFWRRAIFHGAGKIHCLVNADLLDFDVSEACEQSLEFHLKQADGTEPMYRLIVICGSDNENRIVASLFKHRRSTVPYHIETLKQYLLEKLIVPASTEVKTASCVDFDRSSVRLIKSWRAGVGKTLYKRRMEQKLSELNENTTSRNVSIPLTEKTINIDEVATRLLKHTDPPGHNQPRIFHFDLANEVRNGADFLLFNLLVLGCLVDSSGFVWRKSSQDLYLVETTPLKTHYNQTPSSAKYHHKMLVLLPEVVCRSPRECVSAYSKGHESGHDQLFDTEQFTSEVFQRPFQYLTRLSQRQPLNDIHPHNAEGSPLTCLQTLLEYCGVQDPSWAELHHFVTFLNTQLMDFERNEFVGEAAATDLPGFSKFVLRFLVQMSKDFSTRSLNISEESTIDHPKGLSTQEDKVGDDDIEIDGGTISAENGDDDRNDDSNDSDEDGDDNGSDNSNDSDEDGDDNGSDNSNDSDEDGDDNGRDNDNDEDSEEDILQRYQLRRTWETSPHPYLFFNADGTGFTFLGFCLERSTGNLVDQQTGAVLQEKIIKRNLFDALVSNRIPVREDFDKLSRAEQISKLCGVMGNDMPSDPDDTYELTTDNAKKIMAIFMRFRCNIPVIIMGESGCGKTRLVKFMCSLQCPPGVTVNNMILMKVHGGTTKDDIKRKVKESEQDADRNMKEFGSHFFTVLFFDEANTTEAIGLIKEVICDRSLDGEKLSLCENLKMVAACNPYRKHSDELIQKLEKAGLGYHIKAEDTVDTFGHVPMRQLVYRVQPLPQSLLPLVWDFGQLNTQVEERYICQMVRRYIRTKMLPDITRLPEVVSSVLSASQEYMRRQKEECSFVSLRDVDRVLCVMSWFYNQNQKTGILFEEINRRLVYGSETRDLHPNKHTDGYKDQKDKSISDITRCLVLSLGVCYHASLRTRDEYKRYIAEYFCEPCNLPEGSKQMDQEINACQEVFLNNIHLEKNIAKNMALKENVFMMVVCIELRIPLFLVGKPGSSKSLAKTVVADAMKGNASKKQLFKELKQAQMVSFQCSPLSTPDGIIGTFRQCAQFQKDKDLNAFVSVVVLDEVGLAEDSPRMPLKTLHPLLEDGCQGDEKPKPYRKVAFIGISNWALDPAKMNRGILVQRDVPNIEELRNSARGICESDQLMARLEPLIEPLANSYLEIFAKATQHMREFYGLRDFYSLVKMVNLLKRKPTWHELVHAIKRNFGGLYQVDPVECFKKHVCTVVPFQDQPQEGDPDCSTSGLIQACLFDKTEMRSESRYLLLLTENYGALAVLQQQLLSQMTDVRPITIFGSSFRSDQEYTQVCRNINKIKVCMETGNTVILLNLENLYESLYDALNQSYVYLGGERYVDLGLGTHRVKCLVHEKFRLIVVAEMQTVYKEFPIPLINRLEKHLLTTNTMLTGRQQALAQTLEIWANDFASQTTIHAARRRMRPGDVFMGYHDDTCSAVILHVVQVNADDANDVQILFDAKRTLLWCASPDGVVRLNNSNLLPDEQKKLAKIYHDEQSHGSLVDYLCMKLFNDRQSSLQDQQLEENGQNGSQLLSQVTTHSKLLAPFYKRVISEKTKIPLEDILLMGSLAAYDTEQQFSSKVYHHFVRTKQRPSLLIVQCDSGEKNANLVACARYCVMDEYEKTRECTTAPAHVVFIVQLSHSAVERFSGFQSGIWHSVHIDDLQSEDNDLPDVTSMQNKSIATVLGESIEQEDVALDSNYQKLITRCIHLALSMVSDRGNDCKRTTDRVNLLLGLLREPQDKGGMFLKGLTRLIVKLMKDREKTRGFSLSENWLAAEAASQETLQKAGTLRQACLHTIESKIAPVLAGIIAYLDTNHNLDLVSENSSSWQQQLWLAFLSHHEMLSLKYADLMTPLNKSDLSEFTVKSTGCGGHNFRNMVPFSWEIHDIVEKVFNQPVPQERQDTTQEPIEWISHILTKSIGCVLLKEISSQMIEEVSSSYVSDLVHMKYSTTCPVEHVFVCDIVKTAQQNMPLMENGNIVIAIVRSHMAIRTVANDMTCFRAICDVWPDCSKAYNSMKNEKPDHFLFSSTNKVLATLYLLIESLKPETNGLDTPEGRITWLERVHKYRAVVEAVFKAYNGTNYQDNFICLDKTRLLWNRVVITKVFLEHVCVTSSSDTITVKNPMTLWNLLGECADMKKIQTIDSIEVFLKLCNDRARYEYTRKLEKCSVCEKIVDVLLKMPCAKNVCAACMGNGKINGRCPKCSTPLPDTFEPVVANTQRESAEAMMKDYQTRCNSFFMDAVTQLCFTDNTPPSAEVVSRLLSYITGSPLQAEIQSKCTKLMSVFDIGLDPTPVFKSFLLQHLLRSGDVKDVLKQYLHHVKPLLAQDSESEGNNHIQISLLVIQCLEDVYKSRAFADEVNFATNILNESLEDLHAEGLTESKLCSIAGTRMGLEVAADYIRRSLERQLNRNQRELVESARRVCSYKRPLTYLVKYICRTYGVVTFYKLCSDGEHTWLRLEYMDTRPIEMADRLIILGETYRNIRESLTRVIMGEDIKQLTDTYQDLKSDVSHVDLMLQLAIYREVTRLYSAEQNRIHDQVIKELNCFVSTSVVKCQNICSDLVNNRLPGILCVMEQEDLYIQGVQCLLMHFHCTLQYLQGDRTLLQPLFGFMNTPSQYTSCFMPTMPQDDIEDIKESIVAGGTENETLVLYRCPNGHPYFIGDCGRPYYVDVCKCGEQIGGQGHKLLEGNTQYLGGDETKTGHILGRPSERGEELTAERSLTPSQCACLRLLTHMALYLGSLNYAQAMEDMFQPRLESQNISDFLLQHIVADINVLQNVLRRSQDDVLLIAHCVVMKIMNQHDPEESISQEMCLLSSKPSRRDWEYMFVQKNIQPVLKDTDATLGRCNQIIATDKRLGGDPLLMLLYETEICQKHPDLARLQEVDQVWRFRTPISLNHLKLELQNKGQDNTQRKRQHQVLHYFLENEPILRAIKCIPSILRLQRGLLHKYKRMLDRTEATDILLKHLKRDNVLGNETGELLEDFKTAWDIVKNQLKYYACPTEFGAVCVREDLCCSSVDDETPLAMLLPTTRDLGLCSYALLDFLMRKQNDFLDVYNKNTAQSGLHSKTSITPANVTSANLVSFDRQRDLMPLIYANSQYTFALGKGTTIQYDFHGIERQLIDRFFFSKSRIDIGRYLKIELMLYRTEFNNAKVFAELAEKIPQVSLNPDVKQQICSEMSSLPELCKSLDHLDIAVSFLKSIGGDPSMSLVEFMQVTLQMTLNPHSQRAQQSCLLQHAQSLWLLLSLQRSKLMLPKGNRKTIMEAVPDEYTADIPESRVAFFEMYLNNLTVEKRSQLVEVLHDYILLKIAMAVNTHDEDYNDNTENTLVSHLTEYVKLLDNPPIEVAVLDDLPKDILLKHCVHTWMVACQKLFSKQTGRSR